MNDDRAVYHQLLLEQLEEFRAFPAYGNNTCAVWVAPFGSPHCVDTDSPLPACYRLVGIRDPIPKETNSGGDALDDREDVWRDLAVRTVRIQPERITLHWLALLPASLLPDEMLLCRREAVLVHEWLDRHGRPLRYVHHRVHFAALDFAASFMLAGGTSSTVTCYDGGRYLHQPPLEQPL